MTHPSIWSFIASASPVVKCVITLLALASIASWSIIIQRFCLMRAYRQNADTFEADFYSGIDLHSLHKTLKHQQHTLQGLPKMFLDGFEEYMDASQYQSGITQARITNIDRVMTVSTERSMETLSTHLGILATIGSTSPYVGLLGTVWGIMSTFTAMGSGGEVTIASIAPGIAEALIATAIGLFAAIPAVIAYNQFTSYLDRLHSRFELIQKSCITIFHRSSAQRDS